jgi:hypothetical protein
MNPVRLLARSDKWYVGSGGPLLWAPRFPRWLESPGFWDSAHYYSWPVGPLFTATLLDADGSELRLTVAERLWQPDSMSVRYETSAGLTIREQRVVTPGGAAVSLLTFSNVPRTPVRVIVWTAQEHKCLVGSTAGDVMRAVGDGIRWRVNTGSDGQVHCFLTTYPTPEWAKVVAAQPAPLGPRWGASAFFSGAAETRETAPLSGRVVMHGAVGLELTDPAVQPLTIVAVVGSTAGAGERRNASGLDVISSTRKRWGEFFSNVPMFQCSDPYLQRYYWYRWYGLHVLSQPGGAGCLQHRSAVEGPAQFRLPISYSAPCHVRELRWMHDPAMAKGTFLNFIENQRDTGDYPGHLRTTGGEEGTFYHADWAAVADLLAVHYDSALAARAYESLRRYDEYLCSSRDSQRTGLTDVVNHFETGQEYSSRYLAVDSQADAVDWGDRFRLKGVDATVYSYRLKRALASLARETRRQEAGQLRVQADAVGAAILSKMWDRATGMFNDVDPRNGRRTGVKSAVCFYPYMTEVVTREHVAGLKHHLFAPNEFWAPWPVATLSRDDPFFDADGMWRQVRCNCPWNGRVWPMTNSHVVEALGSCGLRLDSDLSRRCGELLQRFVRMMFHDGDVDRPNCYEHYHPDSGVPSVYRGIDDYQHSWVVDLILKYVVGIRPMLDGTIVVAPVPMDVASLSVDGVIVRGREIAVLGEDGGALRVTMDGVEVCSVRRGDAARIVFDEGRPAVTKV